ncbi:MAG: YoaK family protein [Dehalococcoidia bacterium]
MVEDQRNFTWLSCGLAFVGGYSDAASFILAQTFTGHVTGNFVLTAVSLASQDWLTFLRRILAIALFLMGIVLSVILERWLTRKPSGSFLPGVLGLEIILIYLAYAVLTSALAARLVLFVICMALALGLQNGAWREAGGITVHSTYLTGMITNLVTTGTQRYLAKTAREAWADIKISLLSGIWLAFVAGATLGAALVFRFGAPGILGTALVLLTLLLRQSLVILRGKGTQ